jgi:hypothetical protein
MITYRSRKIYSTNKCHEERNQQGVDAVHVYEFEHIHQ